MNQSEHLKNRTKKFAINIVKFFRSLPKTDEARVIGRELLRSATSLAAHYRAVCRAQSRQEFVAKLGIAIDEADQTMFWLELVDETGIVDNRTLGTLRKEADALVAIFAVSLRTVKSNND